MDRTKFLDLETSLKNKLLFLKNHVYRRKAASFVVRGRYVHSAVPPLNSADLDVVEDRGESVGLRLASKV